MYTNLLLWTIYWFLIWGVFNTILKPRGIDYLQRTPLTMLFFLVASIPTLFFITDFIQLYYLAPTAAVCFSANHLARRFFKNSPFLTNKSVDVFFQHIMIYLLFEIIVSVIANAESSQASQITVPLLMGVAFFLVHSPVILLKQITYRRLFFFISFLGGLVFGYLIATQPLLGSSLAYLTHMGFYVIFIWKEGKRAEE